MRALMHHEAFATVQGYLGAHVLQELEGPEWMELIAWPSLALGEQRVAEIVGDPSELVKRHMADCAPGASLCFFEPVLRG